MILREELIFEGLTQFEKIQMSLNGEGYLNLRKDLIKIF